MKIFFPDLRATQFFGEVSEWLKEHAWKVCLPLKGNAGSNPALSATMKRKALAVVFAVMFATANATYFSRPHDAIRAVDFLSIFTIGATAGLLLSQIFMLRAKK